MVNKEGQPWPASRLAPSPLRSCAPQEMACSQAKGGPAQKPSEVRRSRKCFKMGNLSIRLFDFYFIYYYFLRREEKEGVELRLFTRTLSISHFTSHEIWRFKRRSVDHLGSEADLT